MLAGALHCHPLVRLGVAIGAGLVWWVTARSRLVARGTPLTVEDVVGAATSGGLWLILAYYGMVLANSLFRLADGVLRAAAVLQVGTVVVPEKIHDVMWVILQGVEQGTSWTNTAQRPWQVGVQILAVLAALWLARRGRPAVALFLGIFGTRWLWLGLVEPRGSRFAGDPDPADLWWVILLALTALAWWRRGQLTVPRAATILFLVLLTALARRATLVQEPLGVVFGGVGLIVVGLVWNVLTKGAWANGSSPSFPRVGRVFLYLGYVLATAVLVNWVLVSHNHYWNEILNESGTLGGFELFGKPMLYAIIVVALALAATTPTPRSAGERRPAPP